MYNKVPPGMNFAEREKAVLEFWREKDIFKGSIKLRENSPIFTFYEGPPTANGVPHMGHVITRAVKDLFPRYKTMKGLKVLRKAGWDTHGLPVELEVEKELGIDGKPEIEKYGIEPFIKKCKESVWKYKDLWEEMSERVGFWLDYDEPYVTYDNNYIESVWWALSVIWEKGLMYKSYRVVPYCSRCGTPLSSHEVAQGYKDITEDSAYVCFKVKGKPNEFLLAWTTTPWTLPSNVALCVNPKEEYVKVVQKEKVYILAKALVEEVMGDEGVIIETFTGKDLEGLKYEPLFDFAPKEIALENENYCKVLSDRFVTLTDGTGIVHMAPAFGEDDARICKANDMPFLQMVDPQGCFISDAYLWTGKFVKDADPFIIQELDKREQLYKKLSYAHNYPHCWRCDTPLLYYARDAWFIKTSELRNELVASNSEVNWLPGHMKEGRFGHFLENVIDWSISRERYWGTPLPIWECTCCDKRVCIGSLEKLKEFSKPDDEKAPAWSFAPLTARPCTTDSRGVGQWGDQPFDLHRPFIDEVLLVCPDCGKDMKRTPEVIDCWFDSGSMPFAQWHYPFENKELFDSQFPSDFISEAVDQTRGWFYSLIAISTMLFGKTSFKNVIVLGHGLDENGQKMSKSRGNVVGPMDALTKHGADAVRWFLYVNSHPWLNFRYSDDTVIEGARRFMSTFWNTYSFFVLYADIDKFNPFEHEAKDLSVMDKWLLSRLNTLVKNVSASLEIYEVTEPARALDNFVDELSNWYLRRSRERFWAGGMPQDKINAYITLHHALVTLTKLAAPFVPFMTEQIYQNLVVNLDSNAPISLHHTNWPEYDEGLINTGLEEEMSHVMEIVSLGRAARNAGNVKNRQPLPEMLAATTGKTPDESLLDVIREELNIEKITFIDNPEDYTSYKFKPQLRTLGPRYGKLVPKITEALNKEPNKTMDALKSGLWKQTIEDVNVELNMDDVLVETTQKEGFCAASDKGITTVLNIQLTPELIEKGNMRELISKWQNMRREADFHVMDRINAGYSQNPIMSNVIQNCNEEICTEILADSILESAPPEGAYSKEWNVNGEIITMWVKK